LLPEETFFCYWDMDETFQLVQDTRL
jgi:hypothetical protein